MTPGRRASRTLRRDSSVVRHGPRRLARALLTLAVLAGPSATAAQETLEAAALALTEAWAQADLEGLSPLLDDEGVRVALVDKDHGRLDRRNATAALGGFLEDYSVRSATLTRASEVGTAPARGFAEIRWEAVAPGTSEVLHLVLFAGFMDDGDGWRVVEMRILP